MCSHPLFLLIKYKKPLFNVHHMRYIPKKFNLRLMLDKHGKKLVNLDKFDSIIQLISLFVIPSSATHCTMETSYNDHFGVESVCEHLWIDSHSQMNYINKELEKRDVGHCQFNHINQIITYSVITLRGFHCTSNYVLNSKSR